MGQKVAVKTPQGIKYLPLNEVTLNGVPLDKLFKSYDVKIKTISKGIEIFTNKVRLMEKQNTKLNDSNIRLNSMLTKVNKAIEGLRAVDRNIKQQEVVDDYYKFKTDLLLGLLPEPVKMEFDRNNISGNRLKELQEWCTTVGSTETAIMPKEIEIYIGGKLWRRT